MIKFDKVSYSFPQKDLYTDVSFTIEEGQHCAFIGASGSGKSTLIDIIMDPEKYMFDGKLEIDPNCRIGYVRQFQEIDKTKEITVFEYLAEDFIKLQNEITAICTEMETSSDIETLLEKYQEALDAFDAINGDDYENMIDKKLNLIELIKSKDLMISELSGGEFKLIQVIKSMLTNPDLLIMDEPDVFLDFTNLNALKNLINSHKGTTLIITHNRYLLNHCFNKIIHLENMEIQEFDGGYVEYNFSLLQTKIELQELAAADTEEIERNDEIIDRLRELASENAEQFRGKTLRARVKFQERLEKRRIKAPFVEIKEPNIIFVTANEIEEKTALKVTDYNLAFDEVLLEDVNFEIKSNDKVAIIGTNGVGKTTSIGKLAAMNKAEGKKVLLAAADTFRAGAIDQLVVWSERAKVDIVKHEEGSDPAAVVFDAINASKSRGVDLLICDTAGRLHNKKNLMDELGKINRVIDRELSGAHKQTLLVLDGTTGQNAVIQAKQFMDVCPIDGIILTKLDGDTRGGAALSIRHMTQKPIKFIGVGEKMNDFEVFHPDRMANRILGMGDVLSLIEKAQEAIDEKEAKELGQKMMENDFTYDDYLTAMEQMKKLGSLSKIMEMIPGVPKEMKEIDFDAGEKQLARVKAIIHSMTPKERRNPKLIVGSSSRKKRIAMGSGTSLQEVNKLIKGHEMMRKQMKQMKSLTKKSKKGLFGKLPF